MKLLRFFSSIMLVAGVVCMTACSDDDEPLNSGSGSGGTDSGSGSGTDSGSGGSGETEGIILFPGVSTVSLTSEEGATASFRFVSYGTWTSRVEFDGGEEDWFSVSPTSGAGNDDWQTITVTATRNGGEVRTGAVYLITASGDEVSVGVEQEMGILTLYEPELVGGFQNESESEAYISISYANAYGAALDVTTSISGNSAGLTIEGYSGTIDGVTGAVEIPITGTPTGYGDVTITVTASLDGVTQYTRNISTKVYVLYMGFEKFPWGGDYVGITNGVCPNAYDGSANNGNISAIDSPLYDWTGGHGVTEVKYDMNATQTVFDYFDYVPEVEDLFGLTGWSGTRVFMFYHQAKIGNSSGYGAINSPHLTNLPSPENKVRFTADICRYKGDTDDTYVVFRTGTEESSRTTLSGFDTMPYIETDADLHWTEVSFDVDKVLSTDQLRIVTEDVGTSRIHITNIRIELL